MSLTELMKRYIAMWNEPDPDRRRAAIRQLWRADAVHLLQSPADIRDRAASLGFDGPVLQARGHDALEARVTRAYDEFVAPGAFVFRPRGDAGRLLDLVTFRWEMVPPGGGEVAGAGLEVLRLDAEDRIAADYQFIEA
jgi:hypothetical protein